MYIYNVLNMKSHGNRMDSVAFQRLPVVSCSVYFPPEM